jgi:PII-like signaling protein
LAAMVFAFDTVVVRKSGDLLVMIEIVDKEDSKNTFLPELDKIRGEDLVSLEKVGIIRYRGIAPL